MVHKMVKDLLMRAVFVAIIGGILSFVITSLLAPIMAGEALVATIIYLVVLVGIIYLMPKAKVDNETVVSFLVLLGFIAVVGSFITGFAPMLAPYVLSLSSFTLTSLIWAVFYISLAEWVLVETKLVKF